MSEEEATPLIAAKPSQEYNSGTWQKEEHSRFLEGLKRFGKEWSAIHDFVGTRSIKNLVSHGQKFLIRLVKFLDNNEDIADLTLEEAQFFYGVLSKKALHWQSK